MNIENENEYVECETLHAISAEKKMFHAQRLETIDI